MHVSLTPTVNGLRQVLLFQCDIGALRLHKFVCKLAAVMDEIYLPPKPQTESPKRLLDKQHRLKQP